MSKEADECYTPIEIIRALGEFDLDPACGVRCKNKTAKRRFTKNGLERKWYGRVWLNPPFSEMCKWGRKFTEHGNGIFLGTFCHSTKWQNALLEKARAIFVFWGHPKFGRPDGSTLKNRYLTVLIPLGGGGISKPFAKPTCPAFC